MHDSLARAVPLPKPVRLTYFTKQIAKDNSRGTENARLIGPSRAAASACAFDKFHTAVAHRNRGKPGGASANQGPFRLSIGESST